MNEYIKIVETLTNIVWGAAALFMIVAIYRVTRHLKHNHGDIYASLGNPTALVGRHTPNRGRFWKYVRSKEYTTLHDQKLNTMIQTMKLSYTVFVVTCVPFAIFNFLISP